MKRRDLVIDVGMHDGEDTAFYLAKGFRVVAVEANPALVQAAEERFAEPLRNGRLRIFGVAIAESSGTVPIAIADDATEWSSLSPDFIRRNEHGSGTDYRYVDVPAMRFEDILAEVGTPRYLKIDIEGLDMLAVRALRGFEDRPDFVSIESAVSSLDAPFEKVFDELAELWALGYRRFAYVNQNAHPGRAAPNPPLEGAYVGRPLTRMQSGFFGEETPARWSGIGTALLRAQALRLHHNLSGPGGVWAEHPATLPYRGLMRVGWRLRRPDTAHLGWQGWWDLHARM